MKKNNAKRTVVVIALIALMAIPSMFAYFTDTETKTNVFTVGSVDITLEEPAWDEDEAKLVVPGDVIAKDPTITNDGESPAYVFMKVENMPTYCTWDKSDDWTLVPGEDNVYYYNDVLGVGEDATLFTEVTFPTTWTAENGTSEDIADFNVVVTGYAVQSENFADAAAAWDATFGL